MSGKYYSKINVSEYERQQIIINGEGYEKMIKERLLYQLIQQANEDIKMKRKTNIQKDTTEYRIDLAILTTEEYDKLKWIEKEYNRLIVK